MSDSPMPSAILAEKAVLSCFMGNPQRFIGLASAEGVDAECFYLTRQAYDQITGHFREFPDTEEFELVSFVTRLQLNGTLDRCGGPSEIADIASYTHGRTGEWSIWVQQLKEAKARRIARLASQRFTEDLDSDEAIQHAKDTLASLTTAISGKSRAKSGKEAAASFIARWKADFESAEAIPGKATGYTEIDNISGGLRPGQLCIICAKSTRGKSVMMLEIACEFLKRGETVAIFSLEMMTDEVFGRLVTVIGSVNHNAVTQPKASNKHDRAKMGRAIEELVESNAWIDDTPGQTLDGIEAECQRIRDITGSLDLIVIDYMQIVKGERQRGESREQEVSRISMGAKQMAKKFKVPLLTASQLNADGATRESRSLEQDADMLLFIADDGVKVGKMRNGKRDQVLKLFMHGDQQKFLTYPPQP